VRHEGMTEEHVNKLIEWAGEVEGERRNGARPPT
jgi:hypothetical protein